jgi:hypothetical protein
MVDGPYAYVSPDAQQAFGKKGTFREMFTPDMRSKMQAEAVRQQSPTPAAPVSPMPDDGS